MKNLRVQVIEVPTQDGSRSEGSWPRDLLPWADPYVASLLGKLENQQGGFEGHSDQQGITMFELAAKEWLGPEWRESQEAFHEGYDWQPENKMKPIYGGFPLLNDLDDDEDSAAF